MRFIIVVRYPNGRVQWDVQPPYWGSGSDDWGDIQWAVGDLQRRYPNLRFSYIGICI